MCRDLDLDAHVVHAEARHPDGRPDGLVVGHPLLEVARHGREALVVEGQVVRVDAVDLRPALAAGRLERVVDDLERLVDLRVDLLGELDLVLLRVPAACTISVDEDMMRDGGCSPCPEHSILSPMRTACL